MKVQLVFSFDDERGDALAQLGIVAALFAFHQQHLAVAVTSLQLIKLAAQLVEDGLLRFHLHEAARGRVQLMLLDALIIARECVRLNAQLVGTLKADLVHGARIKIWRHAVIVRAVPL